MCCSWETGDSITPSLFSSSFHFFWGLVLGILANFTKLGREHEVARWLGLGPGESSYRLSDTTYHWKLTTTTIPCPHFTCKPLHMSLVWPNKKRNTKQRKLCMPIASSVHLPAKATAILFTSQMISRSRSSSFCFSYCSMFSILVRDSAFHTSYSLSPNTSLNCASENLLMQLKNLITNEILSDTEWNEKFKVLFKCWILFQTSSDDSFCNFAIASLVY